MIYWEYFDRC